MSSTAQMFQQAMQYHQAGNLHQAELLYRRILQLDARHFESLHLLGLIAHQVGRSDLAVATMQQALQIFPDFPAALNNLGVALKALGRKSEAQASFQRALHLQPDFPGAHLNLGTILLEQGKLDEAIARFREALRLQPVYAEAHNNLGNARAAQGHYEDAVACFRQALRQRPNYAEAFNNMGIALREQGKLDEAIASFRQALRLQPDHPETFNNLGNAFRDQDRFDDAIACFQNALRVKPTCAEAYSNMGNVLKNQGLVDDAIARYRRALELKSDLADAHSNLSILLLLQGHFAEGWAEYEWRWHATGVLPHGAAKPTLPGPQWDGSPLQGRSILLISEQGLGDTIQFIRYASVLKAKGAARVIVVCEPRLLRLLRRGQDFEPLVSGSTVPMHDVSAFLLSVPRLAGTLSVADIPARVPYLDCDPELVEHWEARLTALGASRPLLRVGIVWRGHPDHKGDRWRSVPLDYFAPLAQLPGIRLVSLQKGPGSEQLAKTPGLALDLGSELTDMADTAAVMPCLDLVICVDTAVAHLAGALAVPVWLAIAKVPDWRWLLSRDDSPWYPTMRLFRQTVQGQWADVFQRIHDALCTAPRK